MLIRLHLAAVALVAALLAVVAAPASAARTVPQGFYGTNWDREVLSAPLDIQREMWDQAASNGVESARTVFNWDVAQPVEALPPNFGHSDRIMAFAVARNIEVLPVVMYAPEWARAIPEEGVSRPNRTKYAEFLQALVQRYGPNGTFWLERPLLRKKPIRAWQIWNEPEMDWQWQPTQNWHVEYGKLVRTAYRALEAVDPGARVVLAGLANLNWESLDLLYREGHIDDHFDVAAVHAYTKNPKHLRGIVRRFRDVMRRHGDGGLPLRVTEFGASASLGRIDAPKREYYQVTDSQLRDLLPLLYDQLESRRLPYGIERAYWYTWSSNFARDSRSLFDFSGLYMLRADGKRKPRPALASYRRSAQEAEGCVKDVRGRCTTAR